MSGQAAQLAEVSAAGQIAQPGVFHLLTADDDLALRPLRSRITLCGAVVQPSSFPPSCYEEGGDAGRDPRYCPECVDEAVRWSAEAGPVSQGCGGGR